VTSPAFPIALAALVVVPLIVPDHARSPVRLRFDVSASPVTSISSASIASETWL
jgi:hypothetical protein